MDCLPGQKQWPLQVGGFQQRLYEWNSLHRGFNKKAISCMCLVYSINMHVHLFLLRCLYKYSWSKKDNQIVKGDDSHTCSNTESITTKDQWKLLLKDPNYSSYSVLALSPSRKVIAFGNLQGNIKLQDSGEYMAFSCFTVVQLKVTKQLICSLLRGFERNSQKRRRL